MSFLKGEKKREAGETQVNLPPRPFVGRCSFPVLSSGNKKKKRGKKEEEGGEKDGRKKKTGNCPKNLNTSRPVSTKRKKREGKKGKGGGRRVGCQ